MASTSPPPTTSPSLPLVPPLPGTTPPATSSPPPATPAAPPPATPAAPPPATPASPPPPVAPVASPPPPNAPPPAVSSPPPPPVVVASSPPPPVASSPPPPVASSPPPTVASSPPPPIASSPPPPDPSPPPPPTSGSPPPSQSAQPPPPPAANSPPPPPPPPAANPPTGSPPPGTPASPPPTNSPPPSAPPAKSPAPPPSDPSSPPAPVIRTPPPPLTVNVSSSPSPLPVFPTQKPTAKSTTDNNVTVNGTPNSGGGMKTGGVVAVGIIAGFFMISLVIMAVWFTKKKKKKTRRNFSYGVPSPFASSQNSDSVFLRPQSPATMMLGSRSGSEVYPHSDGGVNNNSKASFTYDELIQATNGFSTQNLLGEGGFGCVYKGVLVDGRVVAVKQLKVGGGQGEREFKAEVEIISRVHHRHLVSLVGYCISEHQRLLVYDYVPNNTLHHHLHGVDRPPMAWGIRVKVAAGSARGIAYLHEDCHPRIIHRDIKSSNILLDNSYDAQVSDFGLAKLALDSNTHITTRVMGTFGYMAPEYATSGKLTEKSDVYSFGVVLLELITGRKPVDGSQPLGDESLVEWARPLLAEALDTENFDPVVDPRLERNYNPREMFRMVEAAASCVRHSATKRPRMGQIVRALDNLEDDISDLNNGVKPGQSEVYDSAQQSAQIRMFRRMAFGSQDHSTDFFERTHSSWGSRDHRDQTQSSFGSRGDNTSTFQAQSSWRNIEEESHETTTTTNTNPLAGFWDK